MNFMQKIKKLFISLEDMLSQEHSCISCGKEIIDGTDFQICDICISKLDEIGEVVCFKCGEKLISGNVLCDYCKDFDYEFNSNRSVCYYSEISSRIVKGLKYNGKKYYAKHIARLMTTDKSVFDDIDVITFVPMGKKGLRERGFNQAEELANEISKITNIPVVPLLAKTIEHKHQAGLTQKERLENLKGTFEIVAENEDKIKGERILIIDDVFTTGATLSECAKILKCKKPKKICTLTFAKTKFNSIN